MTERSFARECVKMAAKESTARYMREWFTRDENGMWEREALKLMREVPAYVYSLEAIRTSIAAHLRLLACTAAIKRA